jgi:hypothetical protein
METISIKVCGRCQKELPLSEFWKSTTGKGGIYFWCKSCGREYRKTKQGVPKNIQIHKQIMRLDDMTVNVLSAEDAAYIAGFLDGEGCICLTKNHKNDGKTPSYSINVRISNNCLEALDWVKNVVGYGIVCPKSNKKCGDWALRNSRTSDFLKQLHPYLKIKKLQAEVAMEYAKTLIHEGYRTKLPEKVVAKREELRAEIIALNSRYKTVKI